MDPLEIVWLQAVIDLPADRFDSMAGFWATISDSKRGEVNPEHPEYMHLLPRSGDDHLELQRIDHGPPGVHLDVLVPDIPAAISAAVAAGASVVTQPGHAVLKSPGGLVFCIVPATDQAVRASVIDDGHPHAIDQICLDIPHDLYADEVAFWSRCTGWPMRDRLLAEFTSFEQPGNLPLRVIIQQLGIDDDGPARAHLDISAGQHVAELVDLHVNEHGSTVTEVLQYWTALHDPAGLPYCLTSREPYAY